MKNNSIVLNIRPITPINPATLNLQDLIVRGNADQLTRLDWEVKESGDCAARRAVASAHLNAPIHLHAGISRERWVLQLALAHGQLHPQMALSDLPTWVKEIRDGLTLARIEVCEFGSRREGSLSTAFTNAEVRIDQIEDQIQRLVNNEFPFEAWVLIRELSFGGEFRLCEALAQALYLTGDTGWGGAIYASTIKNIHGRSDIALKIADDVLKQNLNVGALATKASSLGNLGDASPDIEVQQTYYSEAAEVALLLLAREVNRYRFSGNVGIRAFRNIGRNDLSAVCRAISYCEISKVVPEYFNGTVADWCSVLAARCLSRAGRRDLAELQLTKMPRVEWANHERETADTEVLVTV